MGVQVITYGTAEETAHRENSKQAVNAVKVGVTIMAGLMAAAMLAAMSASVQVSSVPFQPSRLPLPGSGV